jgi:hypothetical protein
MATVSATYNGVKKAVDMGKEAHQVMRQLGQWASAADKMYAVLLEKEGRAPGLFESIKHDRSETQEALDMAAARLQLVQMEEEIRHMFLYGQLQELGQAGYSEFVQNRKKIKEERRKAIEAQARRRIQFLDNLFWSVMLGAAIIFGFFLMYLVYDFGVSRGVW